MSLRSPQLRTWPQLTGGRGGAPRTKISPHKTPKRQYWLVAYELLINDLNWCEILRFAKLLLSVHWLWWQSVFTVYCIIAILAWFSWQATNCLVSKIFLIYGKILLWCNSNYFTIENLTLCAVAVARRVKLIFPNAKSAQERIREKTMRSSKSAAPIAILNSNRRKLTLGKK